MLVSWLSPSSMFHGRLPNGSARAQHQQVDQLDAGLRSIEGAQTIISIIKGRQFVDRLIIGHNELGDDGCRTLFSFLNSQAGRRYQIREISLNSNGIGDEGLRAIADYLKDNQHLRELFLQNNALKGAPETAASLATALNSSRLELLSLTTNKNLSDAFLASFLPLLDALHLREIQLSAIGLTLLSGPVITSYLSSPRCRLHVLRCNGNSLGLRAIKSIARTVQNHNYSLRSMELYANRLQEDDSASSSGNNTSDDELDDEAGNRVQIRRLRTWTDCEILLTGVFLRNTHLKREVAKQSFALLCYSRPLLLEGKLRQAPVKDNIQQQTNTHIHSLSLTPRRSDGSTSPAFPFKSLPLELRLYILSYVALSLSSIQRVRIWNYAASAQTLPQLLPPLPIPARSVFVGWKNGGARLHDPPSTAYGSGGTVWPVRASRPLRGSSHMAHPCTGTANALFCDKDKRQLQFLQTVGCDCFELEPGESARGPRELYTLSIY